MENVTRPPLNLSDGGQDESQTMSAGDRLREMLHRAGLSYEAAAKACGYKRASSLQTYVDPTRDFIKYDLVEKLARLLVGRGSPPITAEEVFSLAGVNPVITNTPRRMVSGRAEKVPVEFGAANVAPYGPRDLPILGQARGGDDEYFFGNGADVLSLAYRPIELLNVANAYAVYVHGDSMAPRFEPGELLYVDPVRPARPGDDVIVQMADGQGFVKRLVRRTQRIVICRQFNPEEEIEYLASQVRSVHLIISATRVRV